MMRSRLGFTLAGQRLTPEVMADCAPHTTVRCKLDFDMRPDANIDLQEVSN